ncbi:MAG: type II secretion system F family protein [Oligoflexales bacterium]
MPMFHYKGYDLVTGANRKGKVEADSERTARTKLKQKNKIIVAEIKEEQAKGSAKSKRSIFTPKVSTKELAVMVRQFAVLQEAHVPLDDSLKALVSQVENQVLRYTLSEVKDAVSEGQSLANASAQFPGVFNKLYVNMVRAGESSGMLGTVLIRLADFLEYQVKVGRQIVSAITYPAIMIVASSALVAYLFVSVVPNLAKVFENLKVTLPWYTKFLIQTSEWIQAYWYLIIGAIVLMIFSFRMWVSSDKGRRKWDAFVLKIPLFGAIILRVSIARFTKTLSTLLSSGVPIIQALDITKNVVTNTMISEVLEQAKIEVQEGKSLAACIARSGSFPGLVTHMIATGEQTGELEGMLVHVSDAYNAEVESRITTMISLIEPLMMVVMFAIAGVVIGAMMLPMLSVMSQIR